MYADKFRVADDDDRATVARFRRGRGPRRCRAADCSAQSGIQCRSRRHPRRDLQLNCTGLVAGCAFTSATRPEMPASSPRRMTQIPSPPASVTPASFNDGSWSIVAASADSAAATAAPSTRMQPLRSPWSSSDSSPGRAQHRLRAKDGEHRAFLRLADCPVRLRCRLLEARSERDAVEDFALADACREPSQCL